MRQRIAIVNTPSRSLGGQPYISRKFLRFLLPDSDSHGTSSIEAVFINHLLRSKVCHSTNAVPRADSSSHPGLFHFLLCAPSPCSQEGSSCLSACRIRQLPEAWLKPLLIPGQFGKAAAHFYRRSDQR